MTLIKKINFSLSIIIIFAILWLMLDVIASNTLLSKKENCYNFEKFYYDLKKNCTGKDQFKTSFPIVNIFTNKLGLRTGVNKIKLNKEKNILVFGDSFTFGVGLEYEETYVGILEKELTNYNFYNFAVGSYSPTVHYYRLTQAIKEGIKPNKIFLFLDLTDIYDEGDRWSLKEGFEKPFLKNNILFVRNNKKESFKKRNFKVSRMLASKINFNLRLVRSKLRNSFKKQNDDTRVKTSFQGQFTYTNINDLNKNFWTKEKFENGIIKIKKNVELFNKIALEYSSEFYLVIYPWAETLEFGQKEFSWENFGKELCSNNKCKLINAIPDFIKYKDNDKNWVSDLYFPNDEHFNKLGDKLMADIVKDHLN